MNNDQDGLFTPAHNLGPGQLVAGVLVSLTAHLLLGFFLLQAASAGPGEAALGPIGPMRLPAALSYKAQPRGLEGPVPRMPRALEVTAPQRPHLAAVARRAPEEGLWNPYRGPVPARGRRGLAMLPPRLRWGLDYGQPADDQPLQAMLIPRLGMKEQDPDKLPKILKYEQPDKVEVAVNISTDQEKPKELPKAMKKKDAELDKKRVKKSLSELMDAPEEEDPRARPTMLSEMIGREDGSTYGEGTQAREGEAYLGKLEMRLRQSFRVPAYLTDEELKKLKVEIKLLEMDDRGRIVRYRVMSRSGSPGFDGAALDTIRRFVPSEGGQDSFESPPPQLLQLINAKGLLLKLDGRKLGR